MANEVSLRGTVRWLDVTVRERALARMEEISAGICAALRVSHRLQVTATFPVMRCAPDPIATLAAAAAHADVNVVDPRIPTGLIGIGAGGESCGAHHAPDFDIDERAISLTAEVLTRAALARLADS